jgi:hypothetical protein
MRDRTPEAGGIFIRRCNADETPMTKDRFPITLAA